MADNGGMQFDVPSGDSSGMVTKKYDVGEVKKVALIGPGTAVIARGAAAVLTLSARQEDIEHLEVKVSGDSVGVAFKGGLIRHRGPEGQIRYELTVPNMEELKLTAGLSAEAAGLDGRKIEVELEGGSSLTLGNLRADEFEAKVRAGGRLNVAGTVAKQKVKLEGGSIYQGGDLMSEEADVDAAGGSEASVRVAKKLKARAEGGSSVAYGGDRVELDIQTHGGSVFRQVAG